jgi:predicted nucleotidyltransferase
MKRKSQLPEVLTTLSLHQDELRELGVKSLAVFGSTARNEARPDSDIDLLAEFQRPFGLFKYVQVKEYLEEILGCSVDLVTRDGLHPALRGRILGEAVLAA